MTFLRMHPTRLFQYIPHQPAAAQAADAAWHPAVDIREEQDRYVVHTDVPGVDPKDITISAEENVLTLKGLRTDTAADDRAVYTRRELPRGEFARSFRLPKNADGERISARGKNGVLEIIIPKLEQTKARTIKVDG
ncbi:MAG: Hsp20/alpha crystallin family protein [Pseudomonadota bacterium]